MKRKNNRRLFMNKTKQLLLGAMAGLLLSNNPFIGSNAFAADNLREDAQEKVTNQIQNKEVGKAPEIEKLNDLERAMQELQSEHQKAMKGSTSGLAKKSRTKAFLASTEYRQLKEKIEQKANDTEMGKIQIQNMFAQIEQNPILAADLLPQLIAKEKVVIEKKIEEVAKEVGRKKLEVEAEKPREVLQEEGGNQQINELLNDQDVRLDNNEEGIRQNSQLNEGKIEEVQKNVAAKELEEKGEEQLEIADEGEKEAAEQVGEAHLLRGEKFINPAGINNAEEFDIQEEQQAKEVEDDQLKIEESQPEQKDEKKEAKVLKQQEEAEKAAEEAEKAAEVAEKAAEVAEKAAEVAEAERVRLKLEKVAKLAKKIKTKKKGQRART